MLDLFTFASVFTFTRLWFIGYFSSFTVHTIHILIFITFFTQLMWLQKGERNFCFYWFVFFTTSLTCAMCAHQSKMRKKYLRGTGVYVDWNYDESKNINSMLESNHEVKNLTHFIFVNSIFFCPEGWRVLKYRVMLVSWQEIKFYLIRRRLRWKIVEFSLFQQSIMEMSFYYIDFHMTDVFVKMLKCGHFTFQRFNFIPNSFMFSTIKEFFLFFLSFLRQEIFEIVTQC